MGLYKADGEIFFAEWSGGKWIKYQNYQQVVPAKDLWFGAPTNSSVVQLSTHCIAYDFIQQDGRKNIGGWIETAAGLAGR
jgi:hypothetical protein